MTAAVERFHDDFARSANSRILHRPEHKSSTEWCSRMARDRIPFSSSNTMAEAFAGAGFTVLRCDLPFRQARSYGPPRPGGAERDRDGLRNAVAALQKLGCGPMFLGGHSYGGRQATMLCAEEPDLVVDCCCLVPAASSTQAGAASSTAFASIAGAGLVRAWDADPFGSIEEMESALKVIPAKTELLKIDGAGHDLGSRQSRCRKSWSSGWCGRFRVFLTSVRRDRRVVRAWTLTPTFRCHPERSGCFAWRSSRAVEGPLLADRFVRR